MSDKKEIIKEEVEDEIVDMPEKEEKREIKTVFEGKYTQAIGRRKTSVAQVRLYHKGNGDIAINGKPAFEYFHENRLVIVTQSLKLTGKLKDFDVSIVIKGGGVNAQAEACRHGITRALLIFDEELKPVFKAKGWLTRDSRKVERKKPGLKKARRAPQWAKR